MNVDAAWFSRVGLSLAADDLAAMRRMLAEAGGPSRVAIRGIAHWGEVGEVLGAIDREGVAWDEDEDERQRLWHCAADRLDESTLLRELTSITDALAAPVRSAAAAAAARDAVAHHGLVRAAADSALMAAHQRALAHFAGEPPEHYFAQRYALFEGGRWPLGHYRGEYLVF